MGFWIPSPRAWLNAVIAFVLLIPVLILLRMFGESIYNLLELHQPEHWKVITFIVLVGVIFPAWLWAHVHQFLWGEPSPRWSKWIPSRASWLEGVVSWGIVLAAVGIGLLALHVKVEIDPPNEFSQSQKKEYAQVLAIAFFIGAAYLYHFKILTARWWQNNRRKWFRWPKKKTPNQ